MKYAGRFIVSVNASSAWNNMQWQKTTMILRQGSCPKDEKPGAS